MQKSELCEKCLTGDKYYISPQAVEVLIVLFTPYTYPLNVKNVDIAYKEGNVTLISSTVFPDRQKHLPLGLDKLEDPLMTSRAQPSYCKSSCLRNQHSIKSCMKFFHDVHDVLHDFCVILHCDQDVKFTRKKYMA